MWRFFSATFVIISDIRSFLPHPLIIILRRVLSWCVQLSPVRLRSTFHNCPTGRVYNNHTYCPFARCVSVMPAHETHASTQRKRDLRRLVRATRRDRSGNPTAAHRCNCVPHTSIRTANNTGVARTAYVTIITAGKLRTCNAKVHRALNRKSLANNTNSCDKIRFEG